MNSVNARPVPRKGPVVIHRGPDSLRRAHGLQRRPPHLPVHLEGRAPQATPGDRPVDHGLGVDDVSIRSADDLIVVLAVAAFTLTIASGLIALASRWMRRA